MPEPSRRGSNLQRESYLPTMLVVMSVHVFDYGRRMARLKLLLAEVEKSLAIVEGMNERTRASLARSRFSVISDSQCR